MASLLAQVNDSVLIIIIIMTLCVCMGVATYMTMAIPHFAVGGAMAVWTLSTSCHKPE